MADPLRSLRVSDEEWELLRRAAEIKGVGVSSYIRTLAVEDAGRVVRERALQEIAEAWMRQQG